MGRNLSLNIRLASMMGVFAALIYGIVGVTWGVTEAQKTDAVIINLAGRQRMLTQKLTKATLGYVMELRKTDADTSADDPLVKTIEDHKAEAMGARGLFAGTLNALMDGGTASMGDKKPVLPTCDDDEIRAQLQVVAGLWDAFNQSIDVIFSDQGAQHPEFLSVLNVILARNQTLLAEMNEAVGMFQASSEVRTTLMKNVQFSALGVALVVFGLVVWYIRARVTRPILQNIAMLNDGADQVNDAAAQVSTASQSLAQSASDQASSVEETSSALEQMSAITRKNSENAREANELTGNTKMAADDCEGTMDRLTDAMNGINESSGRISNIIKVIEGIAFQTNLLALNAAVEAALAGEHGKGFAVVAEEVRSLAMRSAKAAAETASLIEDSVGKTKQGADVSRDLNAALAGIVEDVSKAGSLIGEISEASDEQAQGVDQINQAMSRIDTTTQQNAATAEQSAAAAEQLSAQSTTVKSTVANLVHLVSGGAG